VGLEVGVGVGLGLGLGLGLGKVAAVVIMRAAEKGADVAI